MPKLTGFAMVAGRRQRFRVNVGHGDAEQMLSEATLLVSQSHKGADTEIAMLRKGATVLYEADPSQAAADEQGTDEPENDLDGLGLPDDLREALELAGLTNINAIRNHSDIGTLRHIGPEQKAVILDLLGEAPDEPADGGADGDDPEPGGSDPDAGDA